MRLNKGMKNLVLGSLLAGSIALLGGALRAQDAPAAVPTAAPTAQPFDMGAIRIGPGDRLDIVTYRVPELTLRTQVSSDGIVQLPLIGDMKLAGLTVRDAQTKVAEALVAQQYVLHPQVTIVVTDFATQGVSVLGEVTQPGIYPMFGPHRMMDAISAAGGLTTKAGRTVTLIHKSEPDKPISVELARDLAHSESNVEIFPGDTVIVAKAGVVYVVGELNRPGGFLLENNMPISVLQAIALAQGFTKDANTSQARIVRRTPTGLQEIPLQLKKVMAGVGTDKLLNPDDIVFVPTNRAKVVGRRIGDAAVAATSAVVFYGFR